jgi:F-type H+-transporting ATPase subunit b
MDEILRQLGELLVSSVPTMISLLVVWGAYQVIVYRRLQQVLAQRHAMTEGAIQQAQAEIASAEARTAEYEQKVREARAHIYKNQEANRRRMLEQRNAALAEARKQAEEKIKIARAATGEDVAQAKAGLQRQAEALADQIIESIIRPAAAAEGR